MQFQGAFVSPMPSNKKKMENKFFVENPVYKHALIIRYSQADLEIEVDSGKKVTLINL